jgi:hypothetical protein
LRPYYAEIMGRPGVPPGVFFRMLFVGYFEGLKSHRSISWRCTDSRSLGDFLGLGLTDPVPNHSCVSKTHKRQRLPEEVFNEVFRLILSVAARKGLLWGKAIGIDSTTIQANASMAWKVRKDSGKGWKDYTMKLANQAGLAWLRGLASVTKRHLIMVAARNLSTIMRMIFGIDVPRSMQGLRELLQTVWIHFERLLSALDRLLAALVALRAPWSRAISG